jgi:hypothetical protein
VGDHIDEGRAGAVAESFDSIADFGSMGDVAAPGVAEFEREDSVSGPAVLEKVIVDGPERSGVGIPAVDQEDRGRGPRG